MLPHSPSVSEGGNVVGGEEVGEESVTIMKAEVVEAAGKIINCGDDGGARLFSVFSYNGRCGGSGVLWGRCKGGCYLGNTNG
jgi:hypothetical protein